MQKTRTGLVFALAATLSMMPVAMAPANAEAPVTCGCAQPLPTDAATVGSITAASEDVLMSVAEGLAPAKAGAPLMLGSRLLVGPEGSASISVGQGCQLDLAANSSLNISASNGKICVNTASAAGEMHSTFSSSATFGQALPGGGGNGAVGGFGGISTTVVVAGVGALVVGGVVIVAASNDDDGSDDDDNFEPSEPVSN